LAGGYQGQTSCYIFQNQNALSGVFPEKLPVVQLLAKNSLCIGHEGSLVQTSSTVTEKHPEPMNPLESLLSLNNLPIFFRFTGKFKFVAQYYCYFRIFANPSISHSVCDEQYEV
jgi:hypothetical protein